MCGNFILAKIQSVLCIFTIILKENRYTGSSSHPYVLKRFFSLGKPLVCYGRWSNSLRNRFTWFYKCVYENSKKKGKKIYFLLTLRSQLKKLSKQFSVWKYKIVKKKKYSRVLLLLWIIKWIFNEFFFSVENKISSKEIFISRRVANLNKYFLSFQNIKKRRKFCINIKVEICENIVNREGKEF